MPAREIYTIVDISNEKSIHSLYTEEVDETTWVAHQTAESDYRTALNNLIVGGLQKHVFDAEIDMINGSASSNFAERESKLLIRYIGSTSADKFTLEIACPDLDNLTRIDGGDKFVLADGGILEAWVTAFEALARSPNNPVEAVIVQSAQSVGRNI